MERDQAAALGVEALIWLAGREEALGGFLAASGLAPGELRRRAREPELLGFVLDFLLGDEALLLDFAAAAGRRPESVARARAALPGGDAPHWT